MDWLGGFLGWVWARHHNVLSWYVRPLFILPYCWFAYRRSLVGLLLTLLVLATSLFWFPAPTRPDPRVVRYLAWERDLVTGDNAVVKMSFLLLAVGFLAALAGAFWRRSWRFGLAVLNGGTMLKVAGSLALGKGAGVATLAPAAATLAICDAIVVLAVGLLRRRRVRVSILGGHR